jgi:predicted nucleic acid-binding protein
MLYFDTSFLIPYILPESTSSRVQQFFVDQQSEGLTISHWTRVEFASMLAREVRTRSMSAQAARDADVRFEAVTARSFSIVLPDRDDFDLSKHYLVQFETGLRSGDALHLAIAKNRNAQAFYTLDKRLLRAGKLLGLPVSTLSR